MRRYKYLYLGSIMLLIGVWIAPDYSIEKPTKESSIFEADSTMYDNQPQIKKGRNPASLIGEEEAIENGAPQEKVNIGEVKEKVQNELDNSLLVYILEYIKFIITAVVGGFNAFVAARNLTKKKQTVEV